MVTLRHKLFLAVGYEKIDENFDIEMKCSFTLSYKNKSLKKKKKRYQRSKSLSVQLGLDTEAVVTPGVSI